jgi:hypothetical protein
MHGHTIRAHMHPEKNLYPYWNWYCNRSGLTSRYATLDDKTLDTTHIKPSICEQVLKRQLDMNCLNNTNPTTRELIYMERERERGR